MSRVRLIELARFDLSCGSCMRLMALPAAPQNGCAASASLGETLGPHERTLPWHVSDAPAERMPRVQVGVAAAGVEVCVWTQARKALLREQYPAGVSSGDLYIALQALPGRPIASVGAVAVYAAYLSLRRPNRGIARGVWDEASILQLRQLWSEGHSAATIGNLMGIAKNSIIGKAHRLNLESRLSPIGRLAEGDLPKRRQPRLGVTLAPLPSPPPAAPLPRTPPAQQAAAPRPVRLAAYVPPPCDLPRLPAPLTAKQQHERDDAAAIAAFIAANGVTRCPVGVAAPTTAQLDPADAEAQRQRNDALRDSYVSEAKLRGERIALNRARRLVGQAQINIVSGLVSGKPYSKARG